VASHRTISSHNPKKMQLAMNCISLDVDYSVESDMPIHRSYYIFQSPNYSAYSTKSQNSKTRLLILNIDYHFKG
jgi:hypothetical protein